MSLKSKLVKLYEIQKLRYKKKGIKNITIAIITLLTVIIGSQKLCKLIWPQHITHKKTFIVITSFLIHFIFQTLYFLIYAPGYANAVKGYQKYRINKGVIRPWQNNKTWSNTKKRLFYYLGLNYFIVYPAMVTLSLVISGVKYRFDQLPSAWQIGWQLIFVSFVEDAGFYWAHRIAHQYTFMYKYHKIHHQYTEIFSLATQYMHPIDYIVGVLIPSAIPFIILGNHAHCFMFFFWQIWKIMVSTQGHCGYYFPWSPTRIFLFVSDPSFHDFHHSKNIGNYCGSIYLWDYFNGSSQQYFREYGIELGEGEGERQREREGGKIRQIIDNKNVNNKDNKQQKIKQNKQC